MSKILEEFDAKYSELETKYDEKGKQNETLILTIKNLTNQLDESIKEQDLLKV